MRGTSRWTMPPDDRLLSRLQRFYAIVIVLGLVLWGVGAFAPAFVSPAAADTQEATADAHIKINKAGTGAEQSLAIRGPGNQEHWAIFRFTNAPAGTAQVRVRVITARPGSLFLHATGNGWTETGVTWANKPAPGALLDTQPNVAGDVTFNAGTLAAGDVSFYLRASDSSGLTFVAAREHTTLVGPTLITGPAPTTTTVAPTTTTQPEPTTTTTPPTTTTTPPGNCLLISSFASPQAAVDATPVGGCLEADGFYQLTSQLHLTKAMTLQCSAPGRGFFATGGFFYMLDLAANGLRVNGCEFQGPGANGTVHGGGVSGSRSDIRLTNLFVHDLRQGLTSGAGSDVQSDIWVTDSRFERFWGTALAWYYPQESSGIHLLRNTIRETQKGGQAGNAAIQSGGDSQLRHHHWEVRDNRVENPTCGVADMVGYGFDQLTDSVIDHNVYVHCGDPGHPGEGIVVNGPRNQITWNEVSGGLENGSITLISYPGAAQSVHDTIVADNTVVGPGTANGQALALSHAGSDFRGLRVLRNRFGGHSFGIQAYAYQGPIMAGADNLIQDNTLTGNTNGPCSIPAPFTYTSINNNPGC
jgi:hypothetical protein